MRLNALVCTPCSNASLIGQFLNSWKADIRNLYESSQSLHVCFESHKNIVIFNLLVFFHVHDYMVYEIMAKKSLVLLKSLEVK